MQNSKNSIRLMKFILFIAFIFLYTSSCTKKQEIIMVQIDIETTHPFLSLTVAPSDDCITILSSHEIQIPEISPGVYSIILDDIFTSHECIKIKGDLPDNSEISGQTTLKINAINIANNKKVGFADVIHQHPYINRGVVLYFRPETFVE